MCTNLVWLIMVPSTKGFRFWSSSEVEGLIEPRSVHFFSVPAKVHRRKGVTQTFKWSRSTVNRAQAKKPKLEVQRQSTVINRSLLGRAMHFSSRGCRECTLKAHLFCRRICVLSNDLRLCENLQGWTSFYGTYEAGPEEMEELAGLGGNQIWMWHMTPWRLTPPADCVSNEESDLSNYDFMISSLLISLA